MSGAGGMSQFQDLGQRFFAAIVLAIVALAALALGPVATAAFVAIAGAIMQGEWARMARPETDLSPLAAAAMWVITVVAVLVAVASPFWAIALVALGAGVLVLLNDMAFGRITWAGFVWIAIACISAVALRSVPQGFWILLWLILAVVAADAGGYFAGRIFGGPKLWPRVSPKKTWSGFGGGVVLSVLVSLVMALALGGHAAVFALLGAIVAAVALAGDLLESAAKRHFGVKDSGTILPGHGGLLDRFDGLGAVLALVLILALAVPFAPMLGVAGP